MSIIQTPPEAEASVSALSTTATFTWLTGWLPAIAVDAGTLVLKVANLVNSMRLLPAYQLAEVRTDKPSAPTTFGGLTAVSSDNEYFYSASDLGLSSLTPGQTFFRVGVAHYVNTAPNTGKADVALSFAYRQLGRLLAPWSGHLVAVSTTNQFVPITGWMPAMSVVKFAATYVVASLTGNFQVKLTYRTATTSPESPDAWDTTGLGSLVSANTEDNSGELTPTTTGKMWIQLGLMYSLSSGSTPGQADVMVLPAVRESS